MNLAIWRQFLDGKRDGRQLTSCFIQLEHGPLDAEAPIVVINACIPTYNVAKIVDNIVL